MFATGAKSEEMGKVFDTASNNAHTDAHGNSSHKWVFFAYVFLIFKLKKPI